MPQNEIKGGVDKAVWFRVFEDMTPVQRRWAFVSVKMAERHKTFKDMAKRHRMTAWYMSECCQGLNDRSLTPKIKKALESELDVDLTPFMSPLEAWNMDKDRNLKKGLSKPREEAI